MTTTSGADYATKIAALLRKAEDPAATPQEREAYTEKAERLMLKWGIDDAMLEAERTGTQARTEDIIRKEYDLGGDGPAWVMFGTDIARGMGGLRTLQRQPWPVRGKAKILIVIGHESDVARFTQLFESLKLQAELARAEWWKTYPGRYYLAPGEVFNEKRQFVRSFGHRVGQRLAATRSGLVEEAGTGTELVLRDRTAAVNDWIDAKYGKLRSGRSYSGGSWEAAQAGRPDGWRAGADQLRRAPGPLSPRACGGAAPPMAAPPAPSTSPGRETGEGSLCLL